MNPLAGGASRSSGGRTTHLCRTLDEHPDAVLSLDVFDTLLLRDASTETSRLAESAIAGSRRVGVAPAALTLARWQAHDSAYRAVAMTDPGGDARLDRICLALALATGVGAAAAVTFREEEVAVDATHLRVDRAVLSLIDREHAAGRRVIAMSDTYYGADDLRSLFDRVIGRDPFDAVYSSSDLGATKHAGTIFPRVAQREAVDGGRLVHAGDSYASDVAQARAAGWRALHLVVPRASAPRRVITRLRAVPSRWARTR